MMFKKPAKPLHLEAWRILRAAAGDNILFPRETESWYRDVVARYGDGELPAAGDNILFTEETESWYRDVVARCGDGE